MNKSKGMKILKEKKIQWKKEKKEEKITVFSLTKANRIPVPKRNSISAFHNRSICTAKRWWYISTISILQCLLALIDGLRPLLAFSPAVPATECNLQRDLSDQTRHFTSRPKNRTQRIPVNCIVAIALRCQVIDLSDWPLGNTSNISTINSWSFIFWTRSFVFQCFEKALERKLSRRTTPSCSKQNRKTSGAKVK